MNNLVAATLLIFGAPLAAAAQVNQPGTASAPPLPLTLEDAIRRGVEASHRVVEAVARGEAAQAVTGQRHAAMQPQVAAQAGYTRTNHVEQFGVLLPNNQFRIIYPDIPDNYRTRLDLQWPIYTGGRLAALERAARTEAAASADDVDAARADVRLEITRAYWTLVTADESVRVIEASLAGMREHLRDARNRLDAGLVAPTDVLAVEAQEARQRMLGIQVRATRDVVEAELGHLIGVVPGTRIQPVSELALPEPVDFGLDALVQMARERRPERAALVKRVAAAGEREEAVAANRRPTVALGGGVDYARPNPRIFPRQAAWLSSWDASVNMNWPLFDAGRTRADVQEAAAVARAAGARLAEFDARLAADLQARLSALESSRAAVAAAEDAVRAAAEARRVAGDRFAAGVAISSDVLDAQVVLLQAELDRKRALADVRVAEAALLRAIGKP